jgi:aminoglycoside phosphotransferase (APT) family kinase protein
MGDVRAERLGAYLSEQLGRTATVADLRRISVGNSRAMLLADTDAGRFVVRVEQGGVFGTSGAEEFRVMRGLHSAGFPVANVRWYEPTGDVLGQPFFVMDFLEGAAGADERALDEGAAEDFVATLARLHALDWRTAGIEFDNEPEPEDATHAQIDRWYGVYRSAGPEPLPLLEEAAAWLHRYAPPLDRVTVVHGDAGPGNLVHADGRVLALTDWEFAHLGDPAEDWSYCLAMRGARTMPRDTWLDLFERIAGVRLSDAGWRYWEALNLFKGACANCTCLTLFESGVNPAPNMAIIGTTLHQVFLRRLVDITVAPPDRQPDVRPDRQGDA